MKIRLLFFLSFLLLLSACENDLEVVDEYKETLVVYSLINANDPEQYVRVQKAYLGKGNAYLMGQQADSLYPDSNTIVLTLQKMVNGALVDSFIHFAPYTEFIKEEGLFTNAPHLVYRSVDNPLTPQKEDYIDRNAAYRLRLVNTGTATEITSETPVMKDVVLDLTSPLLYPSSNINLASVNPLKIEATLPSGGKILNLTVRLNYTEYTIGSSLIENKVLTYPLEDFVSADAGGDKFIYELSGEDFFSYIRSRIQPNAGLLRPAGLVTLDFVFTIGAEEFFNYYSVGNSSAFLNDVIPSYTNIANGLGLFSSRSTKVFAGKKLTSESQDSLANGRYTALIFD